MLLQAELLCTGCRSTCRIQAAANGSLSDGSGSAQYSPNSNCQWLIAPIGATRITISFINLATQKCCDFICVFSCQSLECLGAQKAKVVELSGKYAAVQTAVSNTGFMLVEFFSDGDTNDDGFDATWVSNAPSQVPVPTEPKVCISVCQAMLVYVLAV
jgi:hypothetical protein